MNKLNNIDEVNVAKYQKKKILKKGLIVGAIVFAGMLAFGDQSQVSASEWVVNTPSQISQRITTGQSSITMISGDTVYNIGEALNIKKPMELLFDNGFKDGEQYSLQVGTVITWDGNHVTVTDSAGTVVGDKVVKDEEKIANSKTVANQKTDTPKKLEIPPVESNHPTSSETPVVVDKFKLVNLYNSVTDLISTDYTVESWKHFTKVRAEAKATVDTVDSTQKQVNQAGINLQLAINNLIKEDTSVENIIDKSAILSLVDEVKALDNNAYTTDSWLAVVDAHIAAINTLSDVKLTQEHIDLAKENLQIALNNLEKTN